MAKASVQNTSNWQSGGDWRKTQQLAYERLQSHSDPQKASVAVFQAPAGSSVLKGQMLGH